MNENVENTNNFFTEIQKYKKGNSEIQKNGADLSMEWMKSKKGVTGKLVKSSVQKH